MKIHPSQLENEFETFVGFRKDAQINNADDYKRNGIRQSLSERSRRNKTISQKRHDRRQHEKSLERINEELRNNQQEIELDKNFKLNCQVAKKEKNCREL